MRLLHCVSVLEINQKLLFGSAARSPGHRCEHSERLPKEQEEWLAHRLPEFPLAVYMRTRGVALNPDVPIRVFGSYGQITPARYTGAATQGNAADGERLLQAAVGHVLPFLKLLDQTGWRPGAWMRPW
jgi:hypothetical protein